MIGQWCLKYQKTHLPSRELTYPTLGKGKSSSKCHFWGGYVSSLEGILVSPNLPLKKETLPFFWVETSRLKQSLNLLMSAKTSTWHWWNSTGETHLLESSLVSMWRFIWFRIRKHFIDWNLSSSLPSFTAISGYPGFIPLSRNWWWWNEIWQIYRFFVDFSIWVFWSVTKQWPQIQRNSYKDVFRIYLRNLPWKKGSVLPWSYSSICFKKLRSGPVSSNSPPALQGQWVGLPAMNFDSKVLEGFGLKQG